MSIKIVLIIIIMLIIIMLIIIMFIIIILIRLEQQLLLPNKRRNQAQATISVNQALYLIISNANEKTLKNPNNWMGIKCIL